LAAITAKLPPGTPVELWWQDEARVGQKTGITRRWARRGTRPTAPKDQRTASAYIFGAICPAEGKGAAVVMPRCNSEAMGMHLEEIAFHIAPGAHAVLILDQAGWHASAALVIPDNITLLPLPPKCPELNPPEQSRRAKMSGSSCATTGSPTASSNHTTISSITAASLGTNSSISRGASCPSGCDNGHMGPDQWDLV
jgi:DDE superfamily endonuclease